MAKCEIHSMVGEISYDFPNIGEKISYGSYTLNVKWKITDFIWYLNRIEVRLDSPLFNFLDAAWQIRLLYHGEGPSTLQECVSLYLHKIHSSTPVHKIQFKIGIVRRDGSVIQDLQRQHTFGKNILGCGGSKCYKVNVNRNNDRMGLQLDPVSPDGALTVVCTMVGNMNVSGQSTLETSLCSANVNESVDAAVQTTSSVGVEKLVHDFENLLQDEEATDMVMKVKNREFKVHKAVLVARSTVFSSMLKHNMEGKNSRFVEIDDCDPVAFDQFLKYLYSGNLENFSRDTVFDLYSITDKYDMQDLKASCVQFMMDNLSTEIFSDVLSLSLKHNESTLLEKAVLFFSENLVDILRTPKWLSFAKENPVEANELHIKAAKYYAKRE